MTDDALVPTFYLYGEPHRATASDFLHVEPLADRSRASGWTIRPHAHAELDQLFVVETGSGSMVVDGVLLPFDAPALLILPAGTVHGFEWRQDSTGWVCTLSRAKTEATARRHPELASVFGEALALGFTCRTELATASSALITIERELAWNGPGRGAALEGALLTLMSYVLRRASPGRQPITPGVQQGLVARFRGRLEKRFRIREPVATYAKALGVSEPRLRAACSRVAGRGPAALLDERTMLEAKRALLYSHRSVAEVGFALGFADPAYFSRFFAKHNGSGPRAFRATRGLPL